MGGDVRKVVGDDAGKIIGGVTGGITGGVIGDFEDKKNKAIQEAEKATKADAAVAKKQQEEFKENEKKSELEKHAGAMRRRTAFFFSQSKPRSTIFTSPLGIPGNSGSSRKTLLGQ